MFRVGMKVVCVNAEWPSGLSRDNRPDGEIKPAIGAIYTIRDIDHVQGYDVMRVVEIVNEPKNYVGGFQELWFLARFFRPVVDISDLTSIVTEVFKGKPRTIAPDKFDKQKIHSSASLPSARHDAAIPVAAWATGIPLSIAPPNSPPPNSGGHAGCPSTLRDDRVVAGASVSQAIIPCRQSPEAATS